MKQRSDVLASDDLQSRVGAGERSVDAPVVRLLRLPATWLVLLVGTSTLVRALVSLQVPSPWILPDEIVYSELAKSIAEGGRPSIRGVPVFGWGEVYPTLIAPAWVVFEDPVRAYRAALAINSLVMSLAAVPAYLLARMFVSRRASVVVAAMTLLVPSMAYTGVLMTENACYPVFLLSVWLMARAVRRPTVGAQALALAGLGLLAFTRIQGAALVGAYVVAVGVYALTGPRMERWSYVRRFLPSMAFAVLVSLAPLGASVARGEGPFGWLGPRSGTFDTLQAHEIPQWLMFLVAGLVLYVAVAPAAATAIVVAYGFGRAASEATRLFASVALPTLAAMLVSVSLVSASLDVDGTENLNERYVFYVVPLLFIGLAFWIEHGLPRPRPWIWVVVAVCCILTSLLPIDRLGYNAGFQSMALLPWLSMDTQASTTAVFVLLFTLALGAFWAVGRVDRVGFLWFASALVMVVAGVNAVFSNANSASNSATAISGRSADWLDRAVPSESEVVVLWQRERETRAVNAEFRLMITEFFNPSVGTVYRVGRRTYYESFLPTVPVRVGATGNLMAADRLPLDPDYILVTCRTPVHGTVVGQSPLGSFDLVRVEPPLRLRGGDTCPDSSS